MAQAGSARRNVLIRFDDDIDGSVSRKSSSVAVGVDLQAVADGWAADLEVSKANGELEDNFESVRQGVNATTLVWVRNTSAVGEEYVCKGASNQQGESAVQFAHIHREYSNAVINAATGLSNPQRQAWSGDAQALETACNNYKADHTDDPIYFFDGFPTE